MDDKPIKILLIEDSLTAARHTQKMLAKEKSAQFDVEIEYADRLSAGLEHIAKGGIDIVLLDLSLPDSDGLHTFTRVQTQAPKVPVVVLSGLEDEKLAIEAVKKGAQDYLVKGRVYSDWLKRSILYAIERKQTEEELKKHREHLEELIEERTAELKKINKQLKNELTDKKQKNEELKKHREHLEELVKERTEKLEKEIAEGKKREGIIKQQSQEIFELSVPVMQVWQGVVVAPLIGTLDSKRTQQFMEQLLNTIVETNSSFALVDITGVPTIDTQTAQNLLETISAVKLLGAQVVLTGVQPGIAQTLVHLGIDLSAIDTRSLLSAGLQVALDTLGFQVVKKEKAN